MLQKNLHAIVPRLALLTAFCFFIESFRILATFNLNYIFLPWNLLLAWVPLYLSIQLKDENSNIKTCVYLALWLVFFPNAPYIITDFLHLRPRDNFPLWYDSILLFSFALTGLLVGIVSAILVLKKIQAFVPAWIARAFMLLVMILSGYGIYVGRFLRYNTWDLLSAPLQIMRDTLCCLIHPVEHACTYGVTLMAGILVALVFSIFESFLLIE